MKVTTREITVIDNGYGQTLEIEVTDEGAFYVVMGYMSVLHLEDHEGVATFDNIPPIEMD